MIERHSPHSLDAADVAPPAAARAGAMPPAASERASAHAALVGDIERLFRASQSRLLRVARLRGIAPNAADDVVQETLLEAWRHLDQLRDPARFDAWLDGICRNVCLRQQRAAAIVAARCVSLPAQGAASEGEGDAADADLADPAAFDPEEELDRQDLETLLDRALGHLPERAREALELCYLAELPQREAAERLRVSIGALEERLRRARKQLRRVLSGALRPEAEAFGLALDAGSAAEGWRETRIWCPFCAAARLALRVRVDGERHAADFSCPGCHVHLAGSDAPEILVGVSSPRAILSRQLVTLSELYWGLLARGEAKCPMCGSLAPVRPALVDDDTVARYFQMGDVPFSHDGRQRELPPAEFLARLGTHLGIHLFCPRCGLVEGNSLTHLSVDIPELWRFWRAHPRIRSLPEYEVEHGGRSAVVSTFESVGQTARLAIITDRETLAILRVEGAEEETE